MGTSALPAALSLASTGFSMFGQSRQASAQATADTYKADQASISAKIGQVQATQTDTYMRNQLQSSMANIMAVNAAQGASSDSPSTAAIMARVTGQSDTDRATRESNIMAQVYQDQGAAGFYQQSANNALTGGGIGELGTLIGGLGGAFKSMMF